MRFEEFLQLENNASNLAEYFKSVLANASKQIDALEIFPLLRFEAFSGMTILKLRNGKISRIVNPGL